MTSEHPLFTVGASWVRAGELAPGDVVRDSALAELRVLSVEVDSAPQRVHNLEVAGAGTYFAGELEAWGHNSTPPTLPPRNVAPGVTHNYGNLCPLPGVPQEHAPVHVNVTVGGEIVRVGENGKPVFGDSINKKQQKIVDCNKGLIRKTLRKVRKWYKWHHPK